VRKKNNEHRLFQPSTGRRRLVRGLPLLAIASAFAPARAAEFELRILTSDDSDPTRQIVRAIERRYPDARSSPDLRTLIARNGPAVYAAIGPGALQLALEADLVDPLISLFTSNEVYTRILRSLPATRRRASITAVYAEAAPKHQMQLIRQLLGRHVTVGVLLTDNTRHLNEALQTAARAAGLELDAQIVDANENVVRASTRVASSQVLLAVPDSTLYTGQVLRSLLESTYRRRQPVIGFNVGMVNAGTLAAAYSSIEDTIAGLGELARAATAGRLPEPDYPRHWRIAINDNVARSLGIVVEEAVRSLGNPAP
jgi:hypothetical protein